MSSLIKDLEQLFEQQIAGWPLLAQGTASLKEAQTRTVNLDRYNVQLRHLPHRIASTTAQVDRESVAKRPCFLCSANLPPQEKGLPFNAEFTIYCNPFPILDRHMTIVHREHRPQQIHGQLENMVAIADALPGYFVIYNGPQCGASAPDHLHFQACSATGVPLIADVEQAVGQTIPNYGRRVVLLRGRTRQDLVGRLSETILAHTPEPLLNLAIFRKSDDIVAALFPRLKHRPAVFYSGELTVSPAAIDLCGIFVVPLQKDFNRITAQDIRRIYQEVAG